MTKHLANILTGSRMFGSILLLFVPVFSRGFYLIYLLCGLSDMIDGTIARKTNSAGKFGSRLDTAADFLFVVVCLVRLLPVIPIPPWLWVWGGVIAAIKIGSIVWGYVSEKQLVALHTGMNRMTGLLLFLLPLTLSCLEVKYSSFVVCSAATFAAVQEGVYVAANFENRE